MFWETETGNYGVACQRCGDVSFTRSGARVEAWERATDHLHREHGLRRVWVANIDRTVAPLVQLALPIIMDGQARARERAVSGPRY